MADSANAMAIVEPVLAAVLILAQLYLLAYLAYLWVPALGALLGTVRRADARDDTVPQERVFTIIVSAHNEESVIGALLWSLALQHYPAEKRRVFVVANNCTDSTATVAGSSGLATVLERGEGGLATKGAALTWLWSRIRDDVAESDYVLIMDADNLVAPNFLSEMNRTIDQGYMVVQGARCPKNPGDSWATRLDAISEALWNRLDQEGRSYIGMSAQIAGSGTAFDRHVFEWLVAGGLKGLCEDGEWQARLALAGIPVGYSSGAKVYDEKTSQVGQLRSQRRRWVAGAALTGRHYGGRLLASAIRYRDPRRLVAAFGATKPPRSILIASLVLLGGLSWLFPGVPALLSWPFWVGSIASFALYILLGMALDGAPPKAYLALAYAPVFVVMMLVASATGTLRASKQKWVPTNHVHGISIDQLPRA